MKKQVILAIPVTHIYGGKKSTESAPKPAQVGIKVLGI